MPDELRPQPEEPGGAPAAPPLAADGSTGRPQRRPSWVRALLYSLIVLIAGSTLGAAGFRLEREYSLRLPKVARVATGWRVTGRRLQQFAGLTLNGTRLLWQNGSAIQYLDLSSGRIRLLGPGPGMRATWAPAVGERYAIWFEAERTGSLAAQAIAYDTGSGRRWTIAEVGSVYSYPAISGDTAVWCTATALAAPRIAGVRIASETLFSVADGSGTPVVSDGLVVWAQGTSGPFTARELTGGPAWSVAPSVSGGRLTGFALSARTLVVGEDTSAGSLVVAVQVDDGRTSVIASGVNGLVGPAFDGETVVWAERVGGAAQAGASPTPFGGYRLMGRRLGGGSAFVIAVTADSVSEVAVSGHVAAWIASDGGTASIETTEVP